MNEMAKQRVVKTSYRSDEYIESLDKDGKLLFLYLLTNELVTLIGIYQITLRRICFDTGIDEETVKTIFKKFEDDKKVRYLNNRVMFNNFIKHQAVNPSVLAGMIREYKSLPRYITDCIETDNRLSTVRHTLLNLTLLNSTKPNSKEKTEGFDKFWEVYPRREAKGNAIKSFEKALNDGVTVETIVAGALAYNERITKEHIEKKYIKLPATWLNQGCWDDEAKINKKRVETPRPSTPSQDAGTPYSQMTDEQKANAKSKLEESKKKLHGNLTTSK